MDTSFLYILLFVVSFTLLGYYFWKDSTDEGYSPIKIFDAYFFIVTCAVIVGKIMFRPLSYDFFRYEFWDAQLTLEGILIGGTIGFIIIIKRFKWDVWKVGDTIASALAIFKMFLFLSFYILNQNVDNLVISGIFGALFALLRFLKKEHNMGSSKDLFQLRRYKKTFFTGILIAIYLTWTSLVAILFLAINNNLSSGFWRIQIGFYIIVFVAALSIFRFKSSQSKKVDYVK